MARNDELGEERIFQFGKKGHYGARDKLWKTRNFTK